MARGKKATRTELLMKKIEEVNKKIIDKETTIAALKEQKAQLESELKEAKLEELSTLLDEKGMTVDEVKAMVENQAEKGEGQD